MPHPLTLLDLITLTIRIYAGKKEKGNGNLLLGKKEGPDMCEDYTGKYHYFSPTKLMIFLHKPKKYACRTAQIRRERMVNMVQKP
jgi:hypothetical protein